MGWRDGVKTLEGGSGYRKEVGGGGPESHRKKTRVKGLYILLYKIQDYCMFLQVLIHNQK